MSESNQIPSDKEIPQIKKIDEEDPFIEFRDKYNIEWSKTQKTVTMIRKPIEKKEKAQ